MTAGDMIATVDNVEPNQYSTGQKLGWLNELDGLVWDEVVRTHVADIPASPAGGHALSRVAALVCRQCPPLHTQRKPVDSVISELLIPFPYGERIYSHYLQAMIASENGEAVKYNQQISLYNAAYRTYVNHVNRTQKPAPARGGNRLRF